MSIKVMTWVWEHSRASGTERLVLLAYADHASHDGTNAYPSHATIAGMCVISRSTVIRVTKKLIELGELAEEQDPGPARGPTRQRSNSYRFPAFRVFAGHETSPEKGCQDDTSSPGRGVSSGTQRGVICDTRGVSLVEHNPSLEPSFDPSLNLSAADAAAQGDLFDASTLPEPQKPTSANDVTAAWIDAFQATGVKPTKTQIGQASRAAKELLVAGNDLSRVIAAAVVAGSRGYTRIDHELATFGRNGQRPPRQAASDIAAAEVAEASARYRARNQPALPEGLRS